MQHAGAVDQLRVGQLGVELRERRGDCLAGGAQRAQVAGADVVPSQLDQRARERARETGAIQHRLEVCERSRRREAEDCPRGDRFGCQSVRRREARVGEFFGGEQADEAVERQAMHSEHRAARDGEARARGRRRLP